MVQEPGENRPSHLDIAPQHVREIIFGQWFSHTETGRPLIRHGLADAISGLRGGHSIPFDEVVACSRDILHSVLETSFRTLPENSDSPEFREIKAADAAVQGWTELTAMHLANAMNDNSIEGSKAIRAMAFLSAAAEDEAEFQILQIPRNRKSIDIELTGIAWLAEAVVDTIRDPH